MSELYDTTPGEEHLDYARLLLDRGRAAGDPELRREIAAEVMAGQLVQIDGADPWADAMFLRTARAFGRVFREGRE